MVFVNIGVSEAIKRKEGLNEYKVYFSLSFCFTSLQLQDLSLRELKLGTRDTSKGFRRVV